MSSYSDYADAASNILLKKGDAQARATEQGGQIWGSTIANLGQVVPQQIQQVLKDRAAKQKTLKIQGIVQKYGGDISQAAPEIMQLDPELGSDLMGKWAKVQDSLAQVDKIKSEAQDRTQKLSDELLLKIPLDDQAGPDAYAHWNVVAHKVGLNPPLQFDKAYVKQLQDQAKAAAAKAPEPYTLAEGAQRRGVNNELLADNPKPTPQPKTKEELALAIRQLPPDDPRRAIYQGTLDDLTKSEGITGPVEDERYRNIIATPPAARKPEDESWRKAYEQQKTLGIDTSAQFAADRQLKGIQAQVAQQARAQGFQESEKGKDRLDKVNSTYHTALSGVDALRETVQAAKSGNVVAGNMQSLLTTMATLKAEGFNRINTAEINATGNAGSMFQNIEGWFGKATAGEPIPKSVQKDMLEYADILEKAAAKKYVADFKSTAQTYGLKNAVPEAVPASAAPPAAPTKNPFR